jgi:hypothetical protein
MKIFHHEGRVYKMRSFHFYHREVIENLGADLRDLIPMRDAAAASAWTAGDYKMLAELDSLICESENILIEEYDEWR